MKIENMASIAEIVSAIAVVLSLLYVGYEIRQGTIVAKSSAYQSIHDSEDAYWVSISEDPVLSTIWVAGLDGGIESLDPNQRAQFSISIRRLIYLYQNVHYQRRKGVIDDELWEAWVVSLDEFLEKRGFVEVLNQVKPHLSDPFKGLLESRAL